MKMQMTIMGHNIHKLSFALVLLAVLLILTTGRVLACSGFIVSFWEAYTSATAVFSGKIIKFDNPPTFGDPRVTFHVLKSWKGRKDEYLVVTAAGYSVVCGNAFEYPLQSGTDTYLVYAYGDDDNLSTTIFGRTRRLSMAGEDIWKLNIIANPLLIVTAGLGMGLVLVGIHRYFLQKMKSPKVNQV